MHPFLRLFCLCGLVTLTSLAHARAPAPSVLLAGDVGQCNVPGAQLTGALIQALPYPVLALGDLAYPNGTPEEFARCYAPHWGTFKARTYPAPGNHDYKTPDAAGYFAYFGAQAGEPARGYYSFDLGSWHIVTLNSNRELAPDSPQLAWLEADLRQHRQRCVMAVWHHPRYSSGPHGNDPRTQAIWETLYRHHVSVVATGHDHDYERFAPMNDRGELDQAHGMRSFVVGTGGAALYELKQRHELSQAFHNTSWGVLKLTLHPTRYEWAFLPATPTEFQDAGQADCLRR
jgi:acid phosphatase type 7